MRKRRILFTAPWYPNDQRVIAPFIQKHAKAVGRSADVVVLAVVNSGWPTIPRFRLEKGEWRESFHELIIHAPSLDLSVPAYLRPLAIIERGIAYLWGYWYARRKIWNGERPDVCHVNVLTEAAALPWLLKKFCDIPYIITEHWSRYVRIDSRFPYSRFHSYVTRRFVGDAYAVCPVSRYLELAMEKHCLVNDRYRIVGNVVDTDLFLPVEGKTIHNPYRFCHVSWFRDEAKNVSGILRTLHVLSKTRQDWEMTMIGDGNDRGKLERLSTELGLSEKVHFIGALQGQALADMLGRQDCFVMFSFYETQCVSLLEALSCGLPAIATNVGDIPNMLACGRGICVDAANESQLLSALSFAIENHWDATPDDRRNYVVSTSAPAIVGDAFARLYEKALDQSSAEG